MDGQWDSAVLADLRQDLQLATFSQELAARRQRFDLMAREGERIALIQRRLAELEARPGQEAEDAQAL